MKLNTIKRIGVINTLGGGQQSLEVINTEALTNCKVINTLGQDQQIRRSLWSTERLGCDQQKAADVHI